MSGANCIVVHSQFCNTMTKLLTQDSFILNIVYIENRVKREA